MCRIIEINININFIDLSILFCLIFAGYLCICLVLYEVKSPQNMFCKLLINQKPP